MLRITEAQMETFTRQQATNFTQRVVNFLKEHLPEYRTVPNEQIFSAVSKLVDGASQHGFETERELIIFVLAAHYLGNDFDTSITSVRTTLADHAHTLAWKANWLEALVLLVEGRRERGVL